MLSRQALDRYMLFIRGAEEGKGLSSADREEPTALKVFKIRV